MLSMIIRSTAQRGRVCMERIESRPTSEAR
jgi:hypothetical protein